MATTDIRIVAATEAHAEALAPTMRPADVEELRALGQMPIENLLAGLDRSEESWTALLGDQVAAMFGVERVQVGGMLSGREVYALWFLTSEVFGRYPVAFIKRARAFLKEMLERWPTLLNLVDGRYTGAMQLLSMLGAHFLAPVDVGGVAFFPFVLRRSA